MHRRSWVVGVGVCVVLAACGDDGTASEGGTMMATSIGPSATEPTTMQTVGEASTADVPTAGSMSQGETLATTAGDTTQDPSGTSAGPTSEGLSTGPSDMGPTCVDTCLDGVCVGEVCCPINQACAETCCDAGQVCSFQTCVVPGNTCVDATDCAEDEYCEYSLGDESMPPMCMGGVDLANGKCLPQPPLCDEGVEPMEGEPITCLPECEVKPPVNDFGIVLKAAWGGQVTPPYSTDIMMAPIVVQLDDDNCDTKVNEKDIPEIVFSTFTGGGYFKQGTLHAISLKDGAFVEKFTVPNVTQPGAGLAAADLDSDGIPEIVGCMNPGPAGVSCCDAQAQNTGVIAFKADGSTFWTQPDTTKVHCGYDHPLIADVYQDGTPEVLVGWTLLDGTTGAVAMELDPAHSWGQKLMGMADLDGDGLLDITSGIKAVRSDGTKIWDLTGVVTNGYHAVGDFDLDGSPEVVIISSGGPHTMSLVRHDPNDPTGAQVIRSGVDINNGISTMAFCNAGSEYGGGPPTVADFNGDGTPDVGAAGAVGYIVFSGALMMDPNVADADIDLWFKTTHDCSSAVTGSSVFDFNGDGKAEVIYNDEYHLWMYDGTTGNNLIPSTCSTTGTLWEYPLVADVDNDGQADIVTVSNAYGIICADDNSRQSGLRVFGSASGSWVRTRRIWNQHTYHVTNIREDGTVPMIEAPNWSTPGLNNYRQNVQPKGEFSAPDVTATIFPRCVPDDYALIARVRNIGQAAVPEGVVVGFYAGDPDMGGTMLGSGMTKKSLYPAEAEDVILEIDMPDPGLLDGTIPVFVVVDDGMPMHTWKECRTTNNKVEGSGFCAMPG